MEWRVLPKGDVGAQFPLLYATLNPQGSIVISRPTHERLGSPDGYLIMFDPLRHRLALKPAPDSDPNAYPARVIGRSGAKIIRAHRMIREFGIQPPETIEFPEAKIVDEVLILDLQTAKPSPRAHSRCRYERPAKPTSPFPFVK
ncbi:MAG: hypothetical protein PSX80_15870 [bacterium]|nr:hypothetical protein [bacterium]